MKSALPVALLSLALLIASAPRRTAAAAEKDAAVDTVLEKFVKAIGGKEAWDKVESRQVTADVEIFGATAEWKLDAKAPNLRAARGDLANIGPVEEGFDGTTAWSKSRDGGVQKKEGDEQELAKREADFRREVRLKELYPNLTVQGTERVNGEEVQVLEAKPTATTTTRFSFSSKTGLLVRQRAEFPGKDGSPVTVESDLSDYREVDGVKYPYLTKVQLMVGGQPAFDFVIKVKTIKHNEKIDDARFKKPAE